MPNILVCPTQNIFLLQISVYIQCLVRSFSSGQIRCQVTPLRQCSQSAEPELAINWQSNPIKLDVFRSVPCYIHLMTLSTCYE